MPECQFGLVHQNVLGLWYDVGLGYLIIICFCRSVRRVFKFGILAGALYEVPTPPTGRPTISHVVAPSFLTKLDSTPLL